LKVLMVVVFFASGCLEIISILFRPISLGFRLYGNVFAGETMLETMARLDQRSTPTKGWVSRLGYHRNEPFDAQYLQPRCSSQQNGTKLHRGADTKILDA